MVFLEHEEINESIYLGLDDILYGDLNKILNQRYGAMINKIATKSVKVVKKKELKNFILLQVLRCIRHLAKFPQMKMKA